MGSRLLLVACLVVLASSLLSQANPGEQACAGLAKAFGYPPMKEPIRRSRQSGNFVVNWGDIGCTYAPDGKVRSIVDFAAYRAKGSGNPAIRSSSAAVEIAKAKLKGTPYTLREPAEVVPKEPWPAEETRIQLSSSRSAYGHSTHGFAGGVGIMLHRFSGRVIAMSWSEEYTPDAPTVKLKMEDAVRLATPLLNKVKEPGRAYSMRALQQYFRPTKGKATAAGLQTLERHRLRYCWVVTMTLGANVNEMSAPVASVAVDAETGQVLTNP